MWRWYRGHGSGKSHLLFGGRLAAERGLVPRWLEHVFDDKGDVRAVLVLCSFLLLAEEIAFDLLDVSALI